MISKRGGQTATPLVFYVEPTSPFVISMDSMQTLNLSKDVYSQSRVVAAIAPGAPEARAGGLLSKDATAYGRVSPMMDSLG